MDAIARENCPFCAKEVALEAKVCPFCERSLLMDVWLEAPIGDNRVRYHVARVLQSLGSPIPPFPELHAALASPRPIVVRSVTRAFSERVRATLAESEIPSVTRPAQPERHRRSRAALAWIAGGALLVAVVWIARPSTMRSVPSGAALPAPRPRATVGPLSGRDLARLILPSSASLRCSNSVGAGFFVAPELLLTNAHVLCAGQEPVTVVFSDRRQFPGDVVQKDDMLDLALVRVSGANAPPLPLGDAGDLNVGDKVVMVGSPLALEFSLLEGTVSNLSRPILGVSYIQISSGVNPGNSGGPLVDGQGRVVGVVSLKHTRDARIGFAIPINYSFTGAHPLLSAPLSLTGSERFDAMVAEAESENRKAAREISSLKLLPGLVGGRVDEYRRLVVHVIRPARSMPPPEEITVKVLNDGEMVCNLKGDVREWKPIDSRDTESRLDDRVKTWLEKVGYDVYVYLGEAPLRFDLCPFDRMTGQVVLEMENADPAAARLGIRVH